MRNLMTPLHELGPPATRKLLAACGNVCSLTTLEPTHFYPSAHRRDRQWKLSLPQKMFPRFHLYPFKRNYRRSQKVPTQEREVGTYFGLSTLSATGESGPWSVFPAIVSPKSEAYCGHMYEGTGWPRNKRVPRILTLTALEHTPFWFLLTK